MKTSSSLALFASLVTLPLFVTGCNRSDDSTNNNPPPTNTVTATTPAPATTDTTATSSTTSSTTPPQETPAKPATGSGTGTPDPQLSSKHDTSTGPESAKVTSPLSENARADTNAAPSAPATTAPSQNSKSTP